MVCVGACVCVCVLMCCPLVARLLQNSALGLEGMGDLRHGLLDLTDTDLTDKVPAAPCCSRYAHIETDRDTERVLMV